MCGIVGCVIKARNGFTKSTEDSFFQMLFADTLRGDDSTGVIYVHNDGGFGIAKEALPAPFVIDAISDLPTVRQMFSKGKAYIGHNRKKTIGAVEDITAHPFVVDDTFALVHNGTLRNHKLLNSTVEVDSEALAIHMKPVLTGDVDIVKFEAAIGKVEGAFAVAAYDQEGNKVHLFRNHERPLAMVECDDGVFWASEAYMLSWVLSRNNIQLKNNPIEYLKPHTLVTIDLDKNTVLKQEYVPKKAIPATSVAGSSVKNTTIGAKNRISKNMFKKMKQKYVGQRLFFYADDFIEKNFPRTIADGETDVMLLGTSEEFTFDHTVSAEYDINNLPKDKWEITDCYFTGLVDDMDFDKGTNWVTFKISGAHTVPKSKQVTRVFGPSEMQEAIDKLEKERYEKYLTTLH